MMNKTTTLSHTYFHLRLLSIISFSRVTKSGRKLAFDIVARNYALFHYNPVSLDQSHSGLTISLIARRKTLSIFGTSTSAPTTLNNWNNLHFCHVFDPF